MRACSIDELGWSGSEMEVDGLWVDRDTYNALAVTGDVLVPFALALLLLLELLVLDFLSFVCATLVVCVAC